MSKISHVTSDSSGRLISFTEGLYAVTVRRDSSGRPLIARAFSNGKPPLESEFKYGSTGAFTGVIGNFESAVLGTLVGEASRGGAVAVGSATDASGNVTGLVGPNGEAVALGGGSSFNNLGTANAFVALGVKTDGAGANDGTLVDSAAVPVASIKANVIPRTDFEANLLNTQGVAGEIASATDTSATVKFNGVLGGAVKFTPYTNVINLGAGALIPVNCEAVSISGAAARTIGAGKVVGQLLEISSSSTCTLTGVGTLPQSCKTTLRWDGAAWKGIATGRTNLPHLSLGFGSGDASGVGALAISSATGSFGALAPGVDSVAIGGGTIANGDGSVCISGGATRTGATGSIAIGASATTSAEYQLAQGLGSIQKISTGMTAATSGAVSAILTTDASGTPSATNEYFPGVVGDTISAVRVTVFVRSNTLQTEVAKFVRELLVNTISPAITIVSNITPFADVNSGLAGASIAISAIGGTSPVLRVTATGVAAKDLSWNCLIESIEGY